MILLQGFQCIVRSALICDLRLNDLPIDQYLSLTMSTPSTKLDINARVSISKRFINHPKVTRILKEKTDWNAPALGFSGLITGGKQGSCRIQTCTCYKIKLCTTNVYKENNENHGLNVPKRSYNALELTENILRLQS